MRVVFLLVTILSLAAFAASSSVTTMGQDQLCPRSPTSNQCCRDSSSLFHMNGGALEQQYNSCMVMDLVPLFDIQMKTRSDHDDDIDSVKVCNGDMTNCTIDFQERTCNNDLVDMCLYYGGVVMEVDFRLECDTTTPPLGDETHKKSLTTTTTMFENKNMATCIASSCSEKESYEVLLALTRNIAVAASGSAIGRVDCKVNSLSRTSGGGSLLGQGNEEEGGGIDGDAIVAFVLAGTILLVNATIAFILFYFRKVNCKRSTLSDADSSIGDTDTMDPTITFHEESALTIAEDNNNNNKSQPDQVILSSGKSSGEPDISDLESATVHHSNWNMKPENQNKEQEADLESTQEMSASNLSSTNPASDSEAQHLTLPEQRTSIPVATETFEG